MTSWQKTGTHPFFLPNQQNTGTHPFFKTSQHNTGNHPFYIGMYIHICTHIYLLYIYLLLRRNVYIFFHSILEVYRFGLVRVSFCVLKTRAWLVRCFFGGLFFFCWVLMAHNFPPRPGKNWQDLEKQVADHLDELYPPKSSLPETPKKMVRIPMFSSEGAESSQQGSSGIDSDGTSHHLLIKTEKNMGALILPWDYLSFFVVEEFQLKMKFWDWGWSWSLFFCASPLKLDSYRPLFSFSVLPLFQDEDDTPWHVQLTQPITLGQGGRTYRGGGGWESKSTINFSCSFWKRDFTMGVDVLNDHQFIWCSFKGREMKMIYVLVFLSKNV